MKRFADRLREARVAIGLTQEQLGFALGVTKSSVSAWENGRETPSFKVLPALRATLRRSLDELVCGMLPAGKVADQGGRYGTNDDAVELRDEKERALILRYRSLPSRRRAALMELLGPGNDT